MATTSFGDRDALYPCIAKTLEGLEPILVQELLDIHIKDPQPITRAVIFQASLADIYRCNILLRTCLKVLVVLDEFFIKDEKDLYNKVHAMLWENYFDISQTFALDSVVNSDYFRHANFAALKVKDAIVDRFRSKFGERPNVDKYHPNFRIQVHIRQNTATISLDSSGESLHKRGYRLSQTDAPLNEVLAAGLVLASQWDRTTTFVDPMCGSGTLLIEAAMIAANKPPQMKERSYTFQNWKNYDPLLYNLILENAFGSLSPKNLPKIIGADNSQNSLQVSKTNIKAANLESFITLKNEDFFYSDQMENVIIITNPPYDQRIKQQEINSFYQNIGDKLKHSYQQSTAWILSANLDAMKFIGLRPSRKIHVLNGSLPSIFCKYELYKGSKKAKWNSN